MEADQWKGLLVTRRGFKLGWSASYVRLLAMKRDPYITENLLIETKARIARIAAINLDIVALPIFSRPILGNHLKSTRVGGCFFGVDKSFTLRARSATVVSFVTQTA